MLVPSLVTHAVRARLVRDVWIRSNLRKNPRKLDHVFARDPVLAPPCEGRWVAMRASCVDHETRLDNRDI